MTGEIVADTAVGNEVETAGATEAVTGVEIAAATAGESAGADAASRAANSTAPGSPTSGSVKCLFGCDLAWMMAMRGIVAEPLRLHEIPPGTDLDLVLEQLLKQLGRVDRSAVQCLYVRTLDRGAIHDDDNLALSNQ